MHKVLFSISYPIREEKREEYLETVRELKNYLTNELGKNYSVFESKTRPNTFNEIYFCKSMEEYDAIEDDADEISEQLINRIVDEFIKDGKTEYKTLIESA
ncbi:MAG: hypothetical protein KFH87_10250 [Bacteroidetes bacterium]|nr:hypothetical protein [Bacteroidota bacterium]